MVCTVGSRNIAEITIWGERMAASITIYTNIG